MNARVQEIMRELPPSVRSIVVDAAHQYGVKIYSIFSPSRRNPVVMARWSAMYRVKSEIEVASTIKISEWFDRDHTSVLSGLARYSAITGKPRLTNYDLTRRVNNPSQIKGVKL
ncbi:helix-turn-helix domain-containing protein [Hoeflea alexandrii]|uniref:Chromosomal replication initiator DnaA C-terminal domain-containing protein n=2 Tax=Hoeflea alexandrii TaxID=288436 RepID=A0ABT1CMJ0_9HYPH|nr:helix-turn-helix domain-containing protein [Hoeflea alexandrii]MCO6407338.1 hypothetical protein [Hoeflea alexandrii]MCY0154265.1 hypothetical protein [Hoeflea alexandrii]